MALANRIDLAAGGGIHAFLLSPGRLRQLCQGTHCPDKNTFKYGLPAASQGASSQPLGSRPCHKFCLDNSLGFVKQPLTDASAKVCIAARNPSNPLLGLQVQPEKKTATETNNNNTMQNYCKTIGALVAASALAAGNASAEIEYEIHTGYSTSYLFRGADLGNDLVEAGVDLATEWNGLGLSAGAWYGSFNERVNIANGGPARPLDTDFDELDLYAEASKDFGFATAAIGYIAYINSESSINGFFPAGTSYDDAQEVYFSLAKSYFGVDFALTYFWAMEGENDGYTTLSASKGFEISPCLTLNTGANLAYLVEQGDFAHLTVKVALDWAFTETATLSPFVAASFSLDDDYNDGDDELVGGAMLSVSF
jgi:hypothetical protein